MVLETIVMSILSLLILCVIIKSKRKGITEFKLIDFSLLIILCFIIGQMALSSIRYLAHYLIVIFIYWIVTLTLQNKQ